MADGLGYILGGVGGILTAALGYLGVRFTTKQARRAAQDNWIERYRNGAERHLMWDVDRRADILELRASFNRLLVELGREPQEFGTIPEPPSLFPSSDSEQEAAKKAA